MKPLRWKLPNLGIGVGLRTVHYGHVLSQKPTIDFFELLSENYMDTGGRPIRVAEQVAAQYPIVMHGVSMNIGTTDPLDFVYLKQLKDLTTRLGAVMVSDHFCWTGVAHRNVHDLLPLPCNEEVLEHIVPRIKAVQDFLERPLFLENPSTYMGFVCSTMNEWDFLRQMAEAADCGLLLDLNNIYVSAVNNGFDAYDYLQGLPMDRVGYFHLAGHSDVGTHLLDTHSDHAIHPVWELYARAHQLSGGRSTIYEWDENVPAWDVLHAEALKAKAYQTQAEAGLAAPAQTPTAPEAEVHHAAR